MTELVRFSFALNPRMHAFVELRDALRLLEESRRLDQPYTWLAAAADLRSSLLGEVGRKQAAPELLALLASMRTSLSALAEKHEGYREQILRACEAIRANEESMRTGLHEAIEFLYSDALLNAYFKALQKHDWLAHRPLLPQGLLAQLWQSRECPQRLSQLLHELYAVVEHTDAMLNDFVGWKQQQAVGGSDQISPTRDVECGLLIIGLEPDVVRAGIVPECSGNRMAIRLRFQRWQAGEAAMEVNDDVSYRYMLVPIA